MPAFPVVKPRATTTRRHDVSSMLAFRVLKLRAMTTRRHDVSQNS